MQQAVQRPNPEGIEPLPEERVEELVKNRSPGLNKQDAQFLYKLVAEKDVQRLCKILWPDIPAAQNLTDGQAEIVRKIAFKETKRLIISAHTRYGKTRCVALGLCLKRILYEGERDGIVAPKKDQADILRNYISESILNNEQLLELADINPTNSASRLRKESSKKKQTFADGGQHQIFSAHGDAERLMGFGVDGALVVDEGARIEEEAVPKLTRMLGDNPEENMLIILMNPWDHDSWAYECWIDEGFEEIHIPWQQGVREGRTTKEYVMEQKKQLPPMAFTVLWESRFPEQSEDAIFKLDWIKTCRKLDMKLDKLREELADDAEKVKTRSESKYKELNKRLQQYQPVIACDPARKGKDWTIVYWGYIKGNQYHITGYYKESTSDEMKIATKLYKAHREELKNKTGPTPTLIRIDGHGIGGGVIDRLNQIRRDKEANFKVKECLFGGRPQDPEVYRNLKAENYFRLRDIVKEGRIRIPDIKAVQHELLKMKWDTTANEKIKIEDPDKSPDWADALVYFIWKDTKSLSFTFI